ncbi:bifunctional 4-hydroxy-2-oxoglutarate aldolase/2-dehydro-3-deoxy-phosphogluconate aldolase [Stenotrophobium rhamnosiphilum]|uniref:2-dehydro-3-deoxy-phosphogluconate aldolase n=1 Tax=Stenotrophobium rhamnosiphilum TaxID=2029166 RepID=A0A2T5MD62_9GAMM|nr:bifunctional 4-hydroxy-2-oxoglutarate aldolase/2-dehydro-3-deoxy-phosphogluconate aldolase [Stenotrophobium rhamnosiphilum]PTU30513.1 keto-deoxy-phosphogluconate aldolase [Stenotrophobium rhamnosiphilum]
MNTTELMKLSPVIPVIVIDDESHAVPMARALVAGGIRVLEVTLRTPSALAAIRNISREVPDAIVGAGTVLNPEHLLAAADAGAQFAVSPGLTQALAAAAKSSGLALLPGAVTPSEIMLAMELGFNNLKFFPAQQSGGVAMLKALHGPFGSTKFCPTGGISLETAAEYLALENVACIGGSWLTPKALMQKQDWAGIQQLAEQAVTLLRKK